MKTKKSTIKRVNLSLPQNVVYLVRILAERDDVSLTTKAFELLEQGLEAEEDKYMAEIAEERLKEHERGEADFLSSEEFWNLVKD